MSNIYKNILKKGILSLAALASMVSIGVSPIGVYAEDTTQTVTNNGENGTTTHEVDSTLTAGASGYETAYTIILPRSVDVSEDGSTIGVGVKGLIQEDEIISLSMPVSTELKNTETSSKTVTVDLTSVDNWFTKETSTKTLEKSYKSSDISDEEYVTKKVTVNHGTLPAGNWTTEDDFKITMSLSDLSVTTAEKALNVGDKIRIGDYWYIVVDKDNYEGGITVLSENVIDTSAFNATTLTGNYSESDIRTYLDGTFYNAITEDKERAAVMISYIPTYTSGVKGTTNDTFFLLSAAEVYGTTDGYSQSDEGSQLQYFADLGVTISDYENAASNEAWMLRSSYSGASDYARDVSSSGYLDRFYAGFESGIRPACNIRSDAQVQPTGTGGYYVIGTKSDQLAPTDLSAASTTDTSITLTASNTTNIEYSIDGTTWQDSDTFTGLDCGTEYTFYARYKETDNLYASKAATLTTTTAKGSASAPTSISIAKTSGHRITVKAITGAEYSIDGTNWQDDNVLSGLDSNTTYTVYVRYKETDTHQASAYVTTKATTTDEIAEFAVLYDDGSFIFQATDEAASGKTISAVYDLDDYLSTTSITTYTGANAKSKTSYYPKWYSDGNNKNIITASAASPVKNFESLGGLFINASNMTSIDFANFDTGNTYDLSYLLSGCGSLTKVKNLSTLKTSNATTTAAMFNGCHSLTSLDVSTLDTSNVTNMSSMFASCYGLTSITGLNSGTFKTNKVTNMNSMFNNCYGLTSLDVSKFNTANVTSMNAMFANCYGLTSLNVGDLNTTNVTDMSSMFYNCYRLSKIGGLDSDTFVTSKVTNMSSMFNNCYGLTSLDVSKFNTANVTNMGGMFASCYRLSKIDGLDSDTFVTSKVTNMSSMFNNCYGLTSLDVSNFDTSKATTMASMFYKCNKLTSLVLNNFVTTNVTSMSGMFQECSGLTALDITGFNTSKVTSMGNMFQYCSKLTSLDLTKMNTSKVTDMSYMLDGCSKLTSLDISSFNTDALANANCMFRNCSALTTIYATSDQDMSDIDYNYIMFTGDTKLVGGSGTTYDTNHITGEYGHIDGGTSNPGYFTTKS